MIATSQVRLFKNLFRWEALHRSKDNPKLFWDAKTGSKQALLPPGPNGPVGLVWLDLSKPHYGIHGTPSPETIGRAESHGCIRCDTS